MSSTEETKKDAKQIAADNNRFMKEREVRYLDLCEECGQIENMNFCCWTCGTKAKETHFDICLGLFMAVCDGDYKSKEKYKHVDFTGKCNVIAANLHDVAFDEKLTHEQVITEYGCKCKK